MSEERSRFRSVIHARVRAVVRRALPRGDDRGDVPGWVLITIMTIGLVAVLWGLAETTLSGMFSDAMDAFGKDG